MFKQVLVNDFDNFVKGRHTVPCVTDCSQARSSVGGPEGSWEMGSSILTEKGE